MISCARCSREGEPAPSARVAFLGSPLKERVAQTMCSECWKAWEEMEIKVINEYRLNFMDPQHRETLKQATLDFLFHQKNLNLPE